MAAFRAGTFQLSDVATAAGRVAAAGPHLPAGQLRFAAVSARTPLTNVLISTADQQAAESLAKVLRLDHHEASDGAPCWSGYPVFPGEDLSARALRVDLIVTGELSEPTLTLLEAADMLDLLAGAVLADIPLVLVQLWARDAEDDEVEIHAVDPSDAQLLAFELDVVDFPLRPVVIAPTT
jgi:hypothetical protein